MQAMRSGGRRFTAALVAALLSAVSPLAGAYTETSGGWNLPTGATEIAGEVYGLHMMMFWVCTVIGIIVFGAMLYSIIMHRKSAGAQPASFHHSTTVEIIWTAIPFAILIAVAVPAAGTLIKMEDTRDADLTIKVTGYQWLWQYEYLGEDVEFFSRLSRESDRARQLGSGIDPATVENYLVDVDRPLVIPVGKKVRFLITSNDVIHAWWVAELAVKKDAIPGYINEAWAKVEKPGIYRGVCAELCGRDHGFMPIVVHALAEDEYAAWLAEQKGGGEATDTASPAAADAAAVEVAAAAPAATGEAPAERSKAELIAAGEPVYKANCVACHQAGGEGIPPSFPSLVGSALVAGDARPQIEQLLKGKNLMPPFRHLSDSDLAAVATYTRNQWGNDGGLVQAADVAALR
jgi:cytochrome c oxidase subunit 2